MQLLWEWAPTRHKSGATGCPIAMRRIILVFTILLPIVSSACVHRLSMRSKTGKS